MLQFYTKDLIGLLRFDVIGYSAKILLLHSIQFDFSHQVVGVAALACGLIAIGTCNGDVTSVILQTMMERSAIELKDHFARFLALGLGLAYLGMRLTSKYMLLQLSG